SEEEKKQIKSKLMNLDRIMKNNTSLPIAEIIYGGSFGKNTILKGRKEADVVFILSPKFPEKKMDNLNDLLYNLFSKIGSISNVEQNFHSLSFTYDDIEVDLLVAKSISKPTALANMSSKQQKRFYASSTKFQVEIAKERGSKFQNTARLLKYWLKLHPEKLCSSFFIELIVAYVFDENEECSYPDLFIKTLEFITETELKVNITFNRGEISYSQVEEIEYATITDPGNPNNNILDTVKNREELIAYAKESLELAKRNEWETVFGKNFPNEEGVVRKKAQMHERKSQHPPDAPNRRYG
ncbi:MAG: hypothetical protein ACTSPP_08615, partial [Candidatus Heimdallarchaeaceae archaeon]